MDDHPTLSNNVPRIAPPRMHARKPSRSPTRNRLGDDLLADLSPATTLEAFTSPSGKLKASIEAATPSERAFGLRATLASKKIQEWVTELSDWPWPAEGGSVGFELPVAKRRKLTNPSIELRSKQTSLEGSTGQNGEEIRYVGSLLAADVERYEDRIDEITDEMDDLNVEDIKRQVLDTHFSPKSRPSSSASNAPPMPSLFASYTKMDDFTAVVTATVLQALPNLSRLMRLMDVWTIRLNVLRKVPPLLRALDDAEMALRSGWVSIRNSREDNSSQGKPAEEQIVSRQTFAAMMDVLQRKVTHLGKDLDFMLDTLEGREDTLPDSWLDRMDLIEQDYGEWVVSGDRKVREGEWAIMEKKRKEEEDARRLKKAELARLKAEQEALDKARLKALREAEEAEAARLDTIAKEAARIKAEEEALEAARIEALRQAEIAEAAKIEAERVSQDLARRKDEDQALEVARLEALRIAESVKIEAARVKAQIEAEEAARHRAEEEELARLRAEEEAEIAEAARVEAERQAQTFAQQQAEAAAQALEVNRVQAIKEAEATRLKAEYEAQVLAARKASEEILEAARLKALRDAEEAEAARLKAKEEAENLARRRVELEAAESERVRLENKALEAAQLRELKDAEEFEIAKLKLEQEGRELGLQKAESEAGAIERLRIERDLFQAEKVMVDQESQESERIRIEREAKVSARLEAGREITEAGIEATRLQDEKDAKEARQKDKNETELRIVQEEEVASVATCIRAEGEAIESEHFKAQEVEELARQKAKHDAINAAKLKAEQDAELARVKAEVNAQELARSQALRDFENAEKIRILTERDVETERLQTEKDVQDALRQTDEQNTEGVRMQAEVAAETIRLKVVSDSDIAARLKIEQDAAKYARLTEQVGQDAQTARQDNVSKQQTTDDVPLVQASKKDPEGASDLATQILQKDLELSHPLHLSRPESASISGTDISEQSVLDPIIKHSAPAQDIVASTLNNPAPSTSMGVVPSTVAVGLGIATHAFLGSSTEEEPNPVSSQQGYSSENLHCGCPAIDGSSDKPSHLFDEASLDASGASDEKLEMPQEMVMDFGIESPIKFDAAEPQTPALGSPIHFDGQFDDQFNTQMPVSSKETFKSQPLPIRISESPVLETRELLMDSTTISSSNLSKPSLWPETEGVPYASQHSVAMQHESRRFFDIGLNYDGAGDSVGHTAHPSVGTGSIVTSLSDTNNDQDSADMALVQDINLPDHIFKSLQFEESKSPRIQTQNEGLQSSSTETSPTLETSEAEFPDQLWLAQTPVNISGVEIIDNNLKNRPIPMSTPITGLMESNMKAESADSFVTPSKFSQSSHAEFEELEDMSSILSPVVEEDLMPSIEVDFLDGSCDACDSYVQGDDGDAPPARKRNTSFGHFDTGMRGFSRSHRDSLSSDTSTIINNRISEDPSSPVATPQLDSRYLDSFPEDIEQSPSAGRVGHWSQKSYEFSPPPSPSATPRLAKQRSLQVLKTPGYGFNDSPAPATPLDAPTFDNVDVTAAPMLASPRKPSNDEQLQQQISSLLETIPARIRLTSDLDSTPSASQTMRPKRTRRSLTPSFRPSSSMSNYSTYSRAPTPSFTLAPAFSKTTQRSRGSVGNPEIKLYHLSRSTGEAPIKLFVRLVGENGERVMVRVGGGWADLGEYLKEYASHHGRRSTLEGGEKIEIQDLPPRVVSGSSITSNTTVRDHGRATPFSRPSSVMGNRPGSSLEVRKTRKSVGATDAAKISTRVSDMRNVDRYPSTPLPSINRRSYDTPPSAASVASSSASASGTVPSVASGRSSRLSWGEEDSSLGLAGPKAKKVIISERDQEWVDSMKEKVKLASAEKERRTRERERLDRERERKTSFGEMDRVGGTKRLFRKSLAERAAALKNEKGGPSGL